MSIKLIKRKINSPGIKLNNILNREKVLKKEYLRLDFPGNIAVSLGEFECAYHCKMCPQNSPVRRNFYPEKREMSFLTFKKIAEQVPDKKDIIFEISALGETLNCRALEDFIKYFKDRHPDVPVMIATNGRFLTKERAQKIIDSGLDILSFGLGAGSPQTYKSLCGSDDYEQVCRNLENFIELRNKLGKDKPKISTHIIGIKQLEHEFKPFIARWKKKVDYISVRAFGNWGGLINETECTPPKPVPTVRYPCAHLWSSTKILSNGDIVKCFVHPYGSENVLGNINTDTLEEIWRGDALNKIRDYHLNRQFEKTELCENCNVWSLFPNIWKWNKKENKWEIKK